MTQSNGWEPVIWINSEYVPTAQAMVSPLDRGFLFGDGLFESLRSESGRVLHLAPHLERFATSANFLRIRLDQTINWRDILTFLLKKNNLGSGSARIKIMATRGVKAGLGLPDADSPTCIAMAERYEPPSDGQYARGWDLAACHLGSAPPLAPHKTLNYLFFMAAKQAALDAGANEALILDGDGNVAETSTGSILALDSRGWWTPKSSCQLPGTALQLVVRLLEDDGFEVERRAARPRDLTASSNVFVTNSLMGVMPVKSIDGQLIGSVDSEKAANLRKRLFV